MPEGVEQPQPEPIKPTAEASAQKKALPKEADKPLAKVETETAERPKQPFSTALRFKLLTGDLDPTTGPNIRAYSKDKGMEHGGLEKTRGKFQEHWISSRAKRWEAIEQRNGGPLSFEQKMDKWYNASEKAIRNTILTSTEKAATLDAFKKIGLELNPDQMDTPETGAKIRSYLEGFYKNYCDEDKSINDLGKIEGFGVEDALALKGFLRGQLGGDYGYNAFAAIVSAKSLPAELTGKVSIGEIQNSKLEGEEETNVLKYLNGEIEDPHDITSQEPTGPVVEEEKEPDHLPVDIQPQINAEPTDAIAQSAKAEPYADFLTKLKARGTAPSTDKPNEPQAPDGARIINIQEKYIEEADKHLAAIGKGKAQEYLKHPDKMSELFAEYLKVLNISGAKLSGLNSDFRHLNFPTWSDNAKQPWLASLTRNIHYLKSPEGQQDLERLRGLQERGASEGFDLVPVLRASTDLKVAFRPDRDKLHAWLEMDMMQDPKYLADAISRLTLSNELRAELHKLGLNPNQIESTLRGKNQGPQALAA